ncbi:MAG: hypothetical protein ACJAU4_000901 [Glaciecola sp.]|jgi:hypothetical protein
MVDVFSMDASIVEGIIAANLRQGSIGVNGHDSVIR